MSNARGPNPAHALACFIADVLRPLRARRQAATEQSCEWRLRWCASEGAEARRFLLVGRALGFYDDRACDDLLQAQADVLNDEAGVPTGPQEDRIRAQLRLTDYQLRGVLHKTDNADPRLNARAIGLLQSNLLANSRLGHGLAAEALAILAFGEPKSCLDALAEVAQAPPDERREAVLTQYLARPEQPFPHRDPADQGLALVASMFHAVQFTRTLDYLYVQNETGVDDAGTTGDYLRERLGESTGTLLHRNQYWRLNFLDRAFEAAFFEALHLAAQALFRLDRSIQQDPAAPDGAEVFANDVVQRMQPLVSVWSAVYAPVPVGAQVAPSGSLQVAGPGTGSLEI